VEQIATLRLIPNMDVWRPCDTVETMVAWTASVERLTGPSSLALSRQNLPFVARDAATIANIKKGGYILSEAKGAIKAVIIATGSEIELALKAQTALAQEEIHVRVVSMPSTNVFDRQDQAWQDSVLPKGLPRVVIEAGVTGGWWKYVGGEGAVIGLDRFGESAPAGQLFKEFGFTVANVVKTVEQFI
jgi:transketolase